MSIQILNSQIRPKTDMSLKI